MKARLYTDGGARGNPGPAAYGYVLEAEDGTSSPPRAWRSASATNNVAEYSGLVAGLDPAVELAIPEVEVRSDSELMVKQMRGEYRVKNEALRSPRLEASRLARQLGTRRVPPRPPRAQRARRPPGERGPGRLSSPGLYSAATRM